MSDHGVDEVVKLIREVGVHRLGGYDGCSCMSFEVRGVAVEISCGKGSPRGINVFSHHLDYWDRKTSNGVDESLMMPIAIECASQIEDGRGEFPITFKDQPQ